MKRIGKSWSPDLYSNTKVIVNKTFLHTSFNKYALYYKMDKGRIRTISFEIQKNLIV